MNTTKSGASPEIICQELCLTFLSNSTHGTSWFYFQNMSPAIWLNAYRINSSEQWFLSINKPGGVCHFGYGIINDKACLSRRRWWLPVLTHGSPGLACYVIICMCMYTLWYDCHRPFITQFFCLWPVVGFSVIILEAKAPNVWIKSLITRVFVYFVICLHALVYDS